jgi:probable F420-dependent oxidoreductase
MSQARPFHIAVVCWSLGSAREWADYARRLEALGFGSLLLPDHFGMGAGPLPGLVAAACATTTLRVGTYVLDNDFRHPAVVAQDAATVDLLSDGRLDLGIGAGWLKEDYDLTGQVWDAPGVRVSRLEESIAILKGLWGDEPFTFEGEHYRINGLNGTPKPLQRPHPPLLIGGGAPRMLRLAAREANIVGLVPRALPGGGLDVADGGFAALAQKVDLVREAAGERFDALELAVLMQRVEPAASRRAAAEQLASEWQVTPEELEGMSFFLLGTPDEMVEQLNTLRADYGVTHISIFQQHVDAFTPVLAQLAGV